VIFADKDLVAQYASPAKMRMRYAAFFAATAFAGLALAGWSWSYMNNRQLVANVQADLDQAIKVQQKSMDLQSRFAALEILQDRIEQLDKYEQQRPLSLSLGLYQGTLLDRKLREILQRRARSDAQAGRPDAGSLPGGSQQQRRQLQPMARPVSAAPPAARRRRQTPRRPRRLRPSTTAPSSSRMPRRPTPKTPTTR
jgi:type VI secretion system protein ImpL